MSDPQRELAGCLAVLYGPIGFWRPFTPPSYDPERPFPTVAEARAAGLRPPTSMCLLPHGHDGIHRPSPYVGEPDKSEPATPKQLIAVASVFDTVLHAALTPAVTSA